MPNQIPILKGKKVKTRILRPCEYVQLRDATKPANQTNLDACLLLGARYTECLRLKKHPEWFDGNFVHLPWTEELAKSKHHPERWIRLSYLGKKIIPYFIASGQKRLPSIQAWDVDLKFWAGKAGLNEEGISARTLRKTYESWLVFSYPNAIPLIMLSQGHSLPTSIAHYISLPFTEVDRQAMYEWIVGWVPNHAFGGL